MDVLTPGRVRVRTRQHPFPVEHDVPIPEGRANMSNIRRFIKRDFGFHRLEVGDSIKVYPQPGQPLIACQNEVSGAACSYAKEQEHLVRFTTRQIYGSFVRCWRVR